MTFDYAQPMEVVRPEDLFFYHTIDLPQFGTMKGDWDLRADAAAYLGNVNFEGKRCLDVGTGTGYLSFKMEECGAREVVSFDIAKGSDWDIVPHYKLKHEMAGMRRRADLSIEAMKKAYWLCHGALKSRAKAYYGNIYMMPEQLGEFDMVFYGMILTHLRDPYLALYNGARLCSDTLVVTGIWGDTEMPSSTFRPAAHKTGNLDVKSWWLLSRGTVKAMIGTMGFEIKEVVKSNVMINAVGSEGLRTCEAIVAKRIG